MSYKMIHYENEEKEIKDLIESNLRQRVLGNTNPVKLGRCFDFLQTWYGIQHGNNRFYKTPNNSESTTQQKLAESYNISVDTIENYIKLSQIIPELEDLLYSGIVTKTTALAIVSNLTNDGQRELISSMDITKKITKKEAKKYINEITLSTDRRITTSIHKQSINFLWSNLF